VSGLPTDGEAHSEWRGRADPDARKQRVEQAPGSRCASERALILWNEDCGADRTDDEWRFAANRPKFQVE
jgi:hypothetical protein